VTANKSLKIKQSFIGANQRGSSVLLILAVAGLSMFLVMTSLQSQADQSYKLFKVDRLIKQDAKAIHSTLNLVLNVTSGCRSNFKGVTVTENSTLGISQIYYGDGAGGHGDVFLDLSSPTQNRFGKKTVTRMNLTPHPTKFGATGTGNHLALFNLFFDDGRQMHLPIYVTTDATGIVQNCHATNFLDSDDAGVERTLEEKYCTTPSTPNLTSHWKTGDCMDCLAGSDPFYYCVTCKKKGSVYDPATQACL
jgi:hypothetical protein